MEITSTTCHVPISESNSTYMQVTHDWSANEHIFLVRSPSNSQYAGFDLIGLMGNGKTLPPRWQFIVGFTKLGGVAGRERITYLKFPLMRILRAVQIPVAGFLVSRRPSTSSSPATVCNRNRRGVERARERSRIAGDNYFRYSGKTSSIACGADVNELNSIRDNCFHAWIRDRRPRSSRVPLCLDLPSPPWEYLLLTHEGEVREKLGRKWHLPLRAASLYG